jgi:hypothetical protein
VEHGGVGEGEEDGRDMDVVAGAAGLGAHQEEAALAGVGHYRGNRPGFLGPPHNVHKLAPAALQQGHLPRTGGGEGEGVSENDHWRPCKEEENRE